MDNPPSQIKRPFIIRGKKEEYLIPENDPHFDQSVESKVSFTQACNWFISFILIYESVKQFYYVFYYEGKCTDYSRIMIYYMIANCFWVVISMVGAGLIRSKQSKKIFIFFVLLIIALISRITIYILMYDTMNHYISDTTLQDCYCRSIYVEDLYMIQAIIEGLILLIIIVFVKIIHKYISGNYKTFIHQRFDLSQKQKIRSSRNRQILALKKYLKQTDSIFQLQNNLLFFYKKDYEQKDREAFFGPGAQGGNLRTRFIGGNSSRINN